MGRKAVQVSGELWQQICTKGWACGGAMKDGLECTEGLPEGAKFCSASYESVAYEAGPILTLILTFEHPDWPEVEPGENVPVIDVVWKRTHLES